jgi:hypothetical protein
MKSTLYYIPHRARAILLSLSTALITEPQDLVIHNKENELINRCEMTLREFPPFIRFGFTMMIYLFDLMPLFFGFGPRRFVSLKLEKKKRYVERWLHTKYATLREAFKGMRGLVMVCYFSHHDIWNYIGYHPGAHVAERIQLRKEIMQKNSEEAKKTETVL